MDASMRGPLLAYVRNANQMDYASLTEGQKQIIREVGVRNLYIQNKLQEIAGAFQRLGISATVLKGTHLMQTLYPFGIRPIEDIDLLVDREDFLRMDAALREMGYRDTAVGMDLWTHLHFSNKITYTNASHPVVPIDIHFSLGPYPYLGRLSPGLLRENTETLDTPAGPLTVLQPEVLLLHVCLHLFQHHFEDWQVSGCDIAAILQAHGETMDWRKFAALVRTHRLALPVAYSFRKAAELAELKIPASFETGTAGAGFYEQWIYRTSQKQHRAFDRHFLQFVTTPGVLLKVRGAGKIIVPGKRLLNDQFRGSYAVYVRHLIKTTAHSMAAAVLKR